VAKTVYITRAPPVVERPLCKGCQKPLKPAYRSKNIELSQDITGMLKDPEAFPAEGCRYVGLGHCSDAPSWSLFEGPESSAPSPRQSESRRPSLATIVSAASSTAGSALPTGRSRATTTHGPRIRWSP